MSSGKPVQRKTNGGIVEYIVADSGGCDAVGMSDPDTVTSIPGVKSTDRIESGVDASQYKPRSASEAYDEELDKENLNSEFTDEENLAETEEERDNIQDVDEEIARDASMFLTKSAGPKGGSQPKDIRAIVEQTAAQALDKIDKAHRPDYDEKEVREGAPQGCPVLKAEFQLEEVGAVQVYRRGFPAGNPEGHTVGERALFVEQRLAELSKTENK